VSQNNEAREQQQRSTQNTPTPWDSQAVRDRPRSRESNGRSQQRDSRESQPQRDSKESQRERIERYGTSSRQQHARNGSANTNPSSQGDYAEAQGGRRHDYDVQSMETALSSPRASMARNPIPPPHVTVRSEYPTLVRSRQSQTLTCLITIEVPEGKWSPDPEDLRGAPAIPSIPQEKEVVHSRSPTRDPQQREWSNEAPEALDEITEDLRVRVDNWHGLDFSRYVTHGTLG
jgi:hypothetical protein